jgi:Ca-activated chloride channel family protein
MNYVMISRASFRVFLVLGFSCAAYGQGGGQMQSYGGANGMAASADFAERDLWTITSGDQSPLEGPGGSVSKLDLKAPRKAREEYDKAYQLMLKKDLPSAVGHLTNATSIYPDFVAAHNALGSAYLHLGQNDQARGEFAQAVSLDDHLPASYFNLGRAELALNHFPQAQESIQKASNIAPLDLHLLAALAYAQYMNHDYGAAVSTAQLVHDRKHKGAAVVHLYAAAALSAQNNIPDAQRQLETLLQEEPKSPLTAQAHQMMDHLKDMQLHPFVPETKLTLVSDGPSRAARASDNVRQLAQASKESVQIAEAEAALGCATCETTESSAPVEVGVSPRPGPNVPETPTTGFTFRAMADEVAVFFAATDHGRSVTDLTSQDIVVGDNRMPPAALTGFRNEAQLPLELGLVVDTSSSITDAFKFEQDAATNFMRRVMIGPNDLGFVVGFSSSVLMVQDFTADQQLISHAVGELAPSGGTALWDAVAFAADKLASRHEAEPVARVLVVISDGEDNSSSVTLKQVINQLQHQEVIVYTISTQDAGDVGVVSEVGRHALKTLSELTGGAAFSPDSVRGMNNSLAELQQVIRGRYLVSYKPAYFKRDGQYRSIEITAEKDGRKLRVYARKGYFASPN